MHVLGIVGPSDSGKTALIERLVPRLRERGRVATVKSIHHDVEVDEPGKDTYRHRQAGATATVGVTPTRTFGFLERDVEPEPATGGEKSRRLPSLLSGFADRGFDVALVEGFAGATIPKVAVGPVQDLDVADPVVARVEDGTTARLGPLVDAVDGLRSFETPSSVLEREWRTTTTGTVCVGSIDAEGLARTDTWTHDRLEARYGELLEGLRVRSSVERASVDVRPPVVPDATAAVHVGVVATDRGGAFDATSDAAERLSATVDGDADVGYLLRER